MCVAHGHALQTDRDDEWHSIDSTISRAHQHAAGEKGALTFGITEGQRHDNRPARELVARVGSACLLGDKAYDSDALRAALAEQNCVPVIPSNGSRAQKLPYDKERYKARPEIECTSSLLKQARRFATRYEKTRRFYAAVVALGCALLWLRI